MDTVTATFVMPAFNAALFIKESIESVLNQSCPHFILMIVDDGSTDRTQEIVKSIDDKRIQYFRHAENLGIGTAMNTALSKITTPYFLILDSDDIALPNRLEEQLKFMEANPDIGVCGSYCEFFGNRNEVWKMPLNDVEIRSRLIWDNVLANSSTIIRTEVLINYDINFDDEGHKPPMEDYRIWLQLIPFTKIANLPKILLKKREHNVSQTAQHNVKREEAWIRLYKWAFDYFGLEASEKELQSHILTKSPSISLDVAKLQDYIIWQQKLSSHFGSLSYMNEKEFQKVLAWKWNNLGAQIKPFQIGLLMNFLKLSDKPLHSMLNYFKKKIILCCIERRKFL